MDVIAENLANADTTRGADGQPYRARRSCSAGGAVVVLGRPRRRRGRRRRPGSRRRPGRRHRQRPEPAAARLRPRPPRCRQEGLRDDAERATRHRDGRPDHGDPRLRGERPGDRRREADVHPRPSTSSADVDRTDPRDPLGPESRRSARTPASRALRRPACGGRRLAAASARCSRRRSASSTQLQTQATQRLAGSSRPARRQDISSVVMEVERASLALQLAAQVRNKAVDAYQEIFRMQV